MLAELAVSWPSVHSCHSLLSISPGFTSTCSDLSLPLPLQLNGIREDVEYYVDENQDDNFLENDFMYDDLDMELSDLGEVIGGVLAASPTEDNFNLSGTSSTNNSNSPSPSPALTNHSKDESRSTKHRTIGDSESDSRVSRAIMIYPCIHCNAKKYIRMTLI
jgi:CCR4-NOT transcriptional regulation complex NOT5 subunit